MKMVFKTFVLVFVFLTGVVSVNAATKARVLSKKAYVYKNARRGSKEKPIYVAKKGEILTVISNGKSIVTRVSFKLDSGYISIECTDWSKQIGYLDTLRVSVKSREFFTWLKNKAYKQTYERFCLDCKNVGQRNK